MLLRFEDAWNAGEPTDLRAFCPANPETAFLKELVRIDIARRRSAGLTIDLDRYLKVFPKLKCVVESLHDLASESVVSTPRRALNKELPARTIPGYELLSELGRDGMGVAYKARQISINRIVALKMILTGNIASEQDSARFRGETEAHALSRPWATSSSRSPCDNRDQSASCL